MAKYKPRPLTLGEILGVDDFLILSPERYAVNGNAMALHCHDFAADEAKAHHWVSVDEIGHSKRRGGMICGAGLHRRVHSLSLRASRPTIVRFWRQSGTRVREMDSETQRHSSVLALARAIRSDRQRHNPTSPSRGKACSCICNRQYVFCRFRINFLRSPSLSFSGAIHPQLRACRLRTVTYSQIRCLFFASLHVPGAVNG